MPVLPPGIIECVFNTICPFSNNLCINLNEINIPHIDFVKEKIWILSRCNPIFDSCLVYKQSKNGFSRSLKKNPYIDDGPFCFYANISANSSILTDSEIFFSIATILGKVFSLTVM